MRNMSDSKTKIALVVREEVETLAEKLVTRHNRISYLVTAKYKKYGSKVEILVKKVLPQFGEKTFLQIMVKIRSEEDLNSFRNLVGYIADLCITDNVEKA